MQRLFALAVATIMALSACTGNGATDTSSTTTTSPSTTSSGPTRATTTTTTVADSEDAGPSTRPRALDAFGDYVAVPLISDSPPYQGPPTPTSVAGIYIPASMAFELDDEAIGVLESQGFVIVPGSAPLFHPLYQEYHYEGEVHFVTTDAGYHFLHLAFSKILRDLEQQELLPILEELLLGLVESSRAQRDELQGTELADAADRVAQLYEAAAVLAELDIGPIGPLAQQEVDLARQATELVKSPITGLGETDPLASMAGLVDYSLFKPRGHYTRNADLERYFRAMSLLGNEAFVVSRGDTMQLASLATRILVEDADLLRSWELIYEPTAFLVGLADDYSPTELADALDQLASGWRSDPSVLTSETTKAAGDLLLETRPVGIDPENASVRIMGVRFVIDSYIYDQLRFPSVGDQPWGRRYATPLDLVAAFGSDLAYEIMDEEGTLTDPDTGERWRNYDSQLAQLSKMLTEREPDEWAATVYDAWLYALEPVWRPLGAAYPDFMQTPAWERKGLQAGLGSYTELKHDTILYAKQSFAAEGDYEPVDYPEPRHWVEPNPVAFARMAAVVQLLADGLDTRGLLPETSNNAALVEALDGFLSRLARIAGEELEGLPISAEDNEWLQYIGSTMEALWIQSADATEEFGDWPDQDTRSALVADIMRTTFSILEIGTGFVDTVYVLVPDDAGRFQIAKGAVYSYYEFWRSADEGRLTDEEWWQLLETNPPSRPAWQTPLFEGGVEFGLAAGPAESCGSLAETLSYEGIVAHWLSSRRPRSMDPDNNGIPCDEDAALFDRAFFAGLPDETGLFCRDLEPLGYSFAEAVAYWLEEGAPDRMDADRNGIPCETVYPTSDVEAFFELIAAG